MQRVITQRLAGLGLAAILTLTAAGGAAVAVFTAGGPGENLSPIRDAAQLIDLTHVSDTILWSSLGGNIAVVETTGWPSSDGVHDLGGALVMESPANPLAGTVNIGEKPATIGFSFSD